MDSVIRSDYDSLISCNVTRTGTAHTLSLTTEYSVLSLSSTHTDVRSPDQFDFV